MPKIVLNREQLVFLYLISLDLLETIEKFLVFTGVTVNSIKWGLLTIKWRLASKLCNNGEI